MRHVIGKTKNLSDTMMTLADIYAKGLSLLNNKYY